jgi:hypothetical protein
MKIPVTRAERPASTPKPGIVVVGGTEVVGGMGVVTVVFGITVVVVGTGVVVVGTGVVGMEVVVTGIMVVGLVAVIVTAPSPMGCMSTAVMVLPTTG